MQIRQTVYQCTTLNLYINLVCDCNHRSLPDQKVAKRTIYILSPIYRQDLVWGHTISTHIAILVGFSILTVCACVCA